MGLCALTSRRTQRHARLMWTMHTQPAPSQRLHVLCLQAMAAVGVDGQGRQSIVLWDISNVMSQHGDKKQHLGRSPPLLLRQTTEYHVRCLRFSPYEDDHLMTCGKVAMGPRFAIVLASYLLHVSGSWMVFHCQSGFDSKLPTEIRDFERRQHPSGEGPRPLRS